MPAASATLVVIPTYNEAESLPIIVRRLRAAAPEVEVLVVDDASPDGTGAIADRMAEEDPAVHVLHRAGKQGLGVAYLAGFGWALQRNYQVICEMDADGSHHPERLPDLLAALETGADLVLGSRWISGGKVENWPLSRELLSRSANRYARIMLGLRVADATAGYRAYRRKTLESLNLEGVASAGYCFQLDLVHRSVQSGHTVVEVPITFTERKHGVSKMTMSVAFEALFRVAGWAFRDRFGRWVSRRGGRR